MGLGASIIFGLGWFAGTTFTASGLMADMSKTSTSQSIISQTHESPMKSESDIFEGSTMSESKTHHLHQQKHQHISTSKTSAHQHISTSENQHISTSAHQKISTSALQHTSTPEHQHIKNNETEIVPASPAIKAPKNTHALRIAEVPRLRSTLLPLQWRSTSLSNIALPMIDVIQPNRRSPMNLFAGTGALFSNWTYKTAAGELLNQQQERSRIGHTSHVGISVPLTSTWQLRGGLRYSMAVAQYQSSITDIATQSVQGNNAIVIGTDGSTSYQRGPVNAYAITTYDVNWYRKHHHLEVFAGLSYTYSLHGRWSLIPTLDIGKTFWSKSDGYLLGTNGSFSKLHELDYEPYEGFSPWIFSPGFAVSYDMKFGSIYGQGSRRSIMGNYLNNSYGYSLTNSQISLELGMIYKLTQE